MASTPTTEGADSTDECCFKTAVPNDADDVWSMYVGGMLDASSAVSLLPSAGRHRHVSTQ